MDREIEKLLNDVLRKLDKVMYMQTLPLNARQASQINIENIGGHRIIPDSLSCGNILYSPDDGPDTYYQTGNYGFSDKFNPSTGMIDLENGNSITPRKYAEMLKGN